MKVQSHPSWTPTWRRIQF